MAETNHENEKEKIRLAACEAAIARHLGSSRLYGLRMEKRISNQIREYFEKEKK